MSSKPRSEVMPVTADRGSTEKSTSAAFPAGVGPSGGGRRQGLKTERTVARRAIERILRDPVAMSAVMTDSTQDFEFWLDPDGRYLFASASCERITGHTSAEFLADPELRIAVVHPDDRHILIQHRRDELARLATDEVVFRAVRPDGSVCWVGHNCRPVFDSDGEFLGTRGSNRDITARKLAEQRLVEQANLIELAHEAIIVCDSDDRIVLWNRSAEQRYGWMRSEAVGKVVHELLKAEYPVPLSAIQETLLHDWQWDGEVRHTRKDGEVITVDSRWALKRDLDGEPRGSLQLNRDITRRKEAEQRLTMANAVLLQFMKEASRQEYLDAVVGIVREWTGCRCVALRLLNPEGRLPFQSHVGFSQQFVDAENQRSAEDHQCACVRVVTGRLEAHDAQRMTVGGSFLTGDNESSARGSARDARLRSCDLCMQAGFASIAVIPVRCGEQTIGAFHMADERPGHVSAKTVEFVESFASMVGEAIRRFDADEELRRHRDHLVEQVELTDAALHASEEKLQGMVEIGQAASGSDRIEGLVYTGMISRHPQMLECLAAVRRLASAPVPVLVRGASGTGKELVARALHDSGVRRDMPYVVVNCAAVPEALLEAELFGIEKGTATGVLERTGKFELADGGTVFLDEIGDMEPALQAKLLRFLQDEVVEKVGGGPPTKVDVRVVAATNQNLEDKMQQGSFRRDLYYRLNTVELLLPPLNGRTADIRDFVFYFIRRCNREFGRSIKGVSELALHRLVTNDWPGNVRQLEHVIERAVLMADGDSIELEDLPHDLRQPDPQGLEGNPSTIRATRDAINRRVTADVEKQMVLDCLQRASWCVVKAAKIAGFSRYHLHRLMRKYSITRPRKSQPEST